MAAISAFDIFKIGVGPSSSHTLGPWRAAQRAVRRWQELGVFDAMSCDTTAIPARIEAIRRSRTITLGGRRLVRFDPATDCRFNSRISLPQHPNGLTFTAVLADGSSATETFYSVGGGFIVQEGESDEGGRSVTLPFPIESAKDLLGHCNAHGLTVPEVVWRNELVWRTPEEIHQGLGAIWKAMKDCVFRGCHARGVLPGCQDPARHGHQHHVADGPGHERQVQGDRGGRAGPPDRGERDGVLSGVGIGNIPWEVSTAFDTAPAG
jgi:L-serine dehydratase